MKRFPRSRARLTASIAALAVVLVLPALAAPPVLHVGHAAVAGMRVEPYTAQWSQKALRDGTWHEVAVLTEKAILERRGGRAVLHHTQTTETPKGTRVVAVMRFDRRTLAPLELEQTFENGPPGAPAGLSLRFDEARLTGSIQSADGTEKAVDVELPEPMFYGMTFGLVLAALPLEEGYTAQLPASMPQMQGKFEVIATVTGREGFSGPDGKPVEAWIVETAWKDLDSGDISPGGAAESGGAYYVVPKPPAGFPYVPKYANANVIIEVKM